MKRAVALFFAAILSLSPLRHLSASEPPVPPEPPEVIAESAVLADAATGTVIYAKSADARQFPASITKVMTALLAIEYAEAEGGSAYSEKVFMSWDAVMGIERGSSNVGMQPGETLSLNECLYALLLYSANEVAAAIGEHISGTQEDFAALMTLRAAELGARGTSFTNPHGLPEDSHYTTAYDMALIMAEAVKHPKFIELIGTREHMLVASEQHPEPRQIFNTNKLISGGTFYCDYIVGGKTGYTDDAMHTLVSYGEKDGMGLVCVILKDEKNAPYTDTKALMDYGFENYDVLLAANGPPTGGSPDGEADANTDIAEAAVSETLPGLPGTAFLSDDVAPDGNLLLGILFVGLLALAGITMVLFIVYITVNGRRRRRYLRERMNGRRYGRGTVDGKNADNDA